MKWSVCIPAVLLSWVSPQQAVSQPSMVLSVPVHARVVAGPIDELSGIAKSRRHPGVYWTHNDSGDHPRLFAIDAAGNSILPAGSAASHYGGAPRRGRRQWQGFEVLQADNVDWEDIAADAGHLYVADLGNNFNTRRDLVIYVIDEIDPHSVDRFSNVRSLPVVYPDQTGFPPEQKHFDSESLFVDGGTLYLLTKHRGPGFLAGWESGAKLYRLDTGYSDRPNVLTLVDRHPGITAATGADLSPDGQTLAVLATDSLWLFERPAVGDRWLSAPGQQYVLDATVFRQAEGVAWQDNGVLLVGNEQRDLFRIEVARLPGR